MKPRVLTYKAKCPINTHGPALSACLWWLQLLQGRLQSRPRQRCTTYARREPVHRIEYRTPFRAHCFRNTRGALLDDRQEMPEQQFHLGSRHAFDHFAHDRGRRHRDAATGALKTDRRTGLPPPRYPPPPLPPKRGFPPPPPWGAPRRGGVLGGFLVVFQVGGL